MGLGLISPLWEIGVFDELRAIGRPLGVSIPRHCGIPRLWEPEAISCTADRPWCMVARLRGCVVEMGPGRRLGGWASWEWSEY